MQSQVRVDANQCHRIKTKKAAGFSKPAMFRKVMQVLEAHHFRLPACRFVLDLFDKRVLEQIVLEEEDDEGSSEEDSGSEDGSDEETRGVNGATRT
jgi:rapamycin-insensitive companion of mTOR